MGVYYFRYIEVSDEILKSIWGTNSDHREMSSTSSISTGNLSGDEKFKKGEKWSESLCGVSVAFIYSYLWLTVQYVAPQSAYLSYIVCSKSFVLCYASIELSYYLFYFLFIYMFFFLFCVFCDLYSFSICILLFLPSVYKCKTGWPPGGNPAAINKYRIVSSNILPWTV